MNCPKCNGATIFPDGPRGETVCSRCGLVVDRAVTSQSYSQWAPEWFSSWSEGDSETLREWLTVLRTISCQLNLPNFPYREEAARTIRLKSAILFRSQRFGKNKREAVAALICVILKKYNRMRSLKDICQSLALDYRLVNKYAWAMNEITKTDQPLSLRGSTAVDYLRAYAYKLTHDLELIHAAENLLKNIQRRIGGNPISLAAGAFYHICKERAIKVSKDEIGKAFHISGRTVYSNERRITKLTARKEPAPFKTIAA